MNGREPDLDDLRQFLMRVLDRGADHMETGPLLILDAMWELFRVYAPKERSDEPAIVKIWLRETAEFAPDVIETACRSLLRKNPRNPFRPTLQDLIERCQSVVCDVALRHWRDVEFGIKQEKRIAEEMKARHEREAKPS